MEGVEINIDTDIGKGLSAMAHTLTQLTAYEEGTEESTEGTIDSSDDIADEGDSLESEVTITFNC